MVNSVNSTWPPASQPKVELPGEQFTPFMIPSTGEMVSITEKWKKVYWLKTKTLQYMVITIAVNSSMLHNGHHKHWQQLL